MRRLAADLMAHAADGIAGAQCLVSDLLQRRLDLLQIRRRARQHANAGLGIGGDGRQRLIDLVGNATGELGESSLA